MLTDSLSSIVPERRMEIIKAFQDEVWANAEQFLSAPLDDVLRDLAYDLDFYEPDPGKRAEDRAYFGDEQFRDLVRAALDAPSWPET